jgi:hypothetical protein
VQLSNSGITKLQLRLDNGMQTSVTYLANNGMVTGTLSFGGSPLTATFELPPAGPTIKFMLVCFTSQMYDTLFEGALYYASTDHDGQLEQIALAQIGDSVGCV